MNGMNPVDPALFVHTVTFSFGFGPKMLMNVGESCLFVLLDTSADASFINERALPQLISYSSVGCSNVTFRGDNNTIIDHNDTVVADIKLHKNTSNFNHPLIVSPSTPYDVIIRTEILSLRRLRIGLKNRRACLPDCITISLLEKESVLPSVMSGSSDFMPLNDHNDIIPKLLVDDLDFSNHHYSRCSHQPRLAF
jgi:hypothetical protein